MLTGIIIAIGGIIGVLMVLGLAFFVWDFFNYFEDDKNSD